MRWRIIFATETDTNSYINQSWWCTRLITLYFIDVYALALFFIFSSKFVSMLERRTFPILILCRFLQQHLLVQLHTYVSLALNKDMKFNLEDPLEKRSVHYSQGVIGNTTFGRMKSMQILIKSCI
jgi:hypothetical protein